MVTEPEPFHTAGTEVETGHALMDEIEMVTVILPGYKVKKLQETVRVSRARNVVARRIDPFVMLRQNDVERLHGTGQEACLLYRP